MLTVQQVQQAAEAVYKAAWKTPLLYSHTFSHIAGCDLYLKAENLQRAGSFKIRGATNKISRLDPRATRGVVAASAGNHAQGVALAARSVGLPATIVMPKDASLAKVQATRGYGAEVLLHGASYAEARQHAELLAEQRALTLIDAFDDEDIMAGQGTIGLELAKDLPDLHTLLAPVGGGGLISGVAVAVKALHPRVRVIGVQASACPSYVVSRQKRRPTTVKPTNTLADGIAISRPGKLTFPVMQRYVDEVLEVTEEEIARAMVLLLERSKQVVEGAGAVGVAALLAGKVSMPPGAKAAAVLSGGNLDVTLLNRVVEHGLAHAGRYVLITVQVPDRPGRLARVLSCLAEQGLNVMDVTHHRRGFPIPVGQVEIQILVETRDPEHVAEVGRQLEAWGYVPMEPAKAPTVGPLSPLAYREPESG